MATDETAHPGSVFRMDHCFVHDGNGGNNVKTRAERNEIRYNWIEGALYHELELIGPDGQDPSLAREDSDVVGNVLFKRNGFYVIRIGGDGTGDTNGRYRFLNNTIVVQPGGSAVFRIFDGIESLEAHNNLFAVDGGSSMTLLRDEDASWSNGRMVAGSYNGMPSGADAPSEWTANLLHDDPGFVSLAGSDVRLEAYSPFVDAGTSTTAAVSGYAFPDPLDRPEYVPVVHAVAPSNAGLDRPDDGMPDIGAFEAGSTEPGTGGTGGTSGSGGTAGTGSGGTAGAGGTSGTGGTGGTSGSGGTAGTGGGTAGTGGTGGDPGSVAPGGSGGDTQAPPDGTAGQAGSAGSVGYEQTGGSAESSAGGSKADAAGDTEDGASGSWDGQNDEDATGIACATTPGHLSSGPVGQVLLAVLSMLFIRRRRGWQYQSGGTANHGGS